MAWWLKRRSHITHARCPGSNAACCVIYIFCFTGIFEYISKTRPEFCSVWTVKTEPENSRPYTFCTATLQSIYRNYPVNLLQWNSFQRHFMPVKIHEKYTIFSPNSRGQYQSFWNFVGKKENRLRAEVFQYFFAL